MAICRSWLRPKCKSMVVDESFSVILLLLWIFLQSCFHPQNLHLIFSLYKDQRSAATQKIHQTLSDSPAHLGKPWIRYILHIGKRFLTCFLLSSGQLLTWLSSFQALGSIYSPMPWLLGKLTWVCWWTSSSCPFLCQWSLLQCFPHGWTFLPVI